MTRLKTMRKNRRREEEDFKFNLGKCLVIYYRNEIVGQEGVATCNYHREEGGRVVSRIFLDKEDLFTIYIRDLV